MTKIKIHGVGVNDADYIVQPKINGKRVTCPFYQVWKDMMVRCYSDNYHDRQPTYIGCSVTKEWITFMNFRSWMITQDWVGNGLDKDIIEPGNKIYSPDNCVFVSQTINNLLTNRTNKRGDYPQGVVLHPCGKFKSQCRAGKGQQHIGYFDTAEEASAAYRKFKYSHVIKIASQQTDNRVRQGLFLHADLILNPVII